ncbi:MAG: HD domain-containing protein, partial [Kiritimatiellia bacterium]
MDDIEIFPTLDVPGLTRSDLALIQGHFCRYLDGFRDRAGALPFMLRLKWEHSQRVAEDMRSMSAELGWAESVVFAATALGLLHDLGRFEQYRRYQTFRDADSVDHGALGAMILEDTGWLKNYPAQLRSQLIYGIRMHNARFLPDGAGPESGALLRLVRDADKLDIYLVLYEAWRDGQALREPDVFHNVDIHGPPSAAVLDDLRARRIVCHGNVRSLADFFLTQLSWVYDLNYSAAY